MTQTTDLQATAAALRENDRFLVVTHENPDGDALGSLLAMTLGLHQLGKDVDMYHHHDNTRFGDVNYIVADASSTGEILRDVFRELDIEITPDIAEPLYV